MSLLSSPGPGPDLTPHCFHLTSSSKSGSRQRKGGRDAYSWEMSLDSYRKSMTEHALCIKHHAGHVLYILPGLHLRGRFCEKHAPFCLPPSQELALSTTWHSSRNLRVVHDLLSNPWTLSPTLLTVHGHPGSKWKRNVPKGASL